jgi:hypothetical protein
MQFIFLINTSKYADFWDIHDSMDYLDNLEEIEMEVDIQKRHYLIEVDMKIAGS